MTLDMRLLPPDAKNRVGTMVPKHITIHETSIGLERAPENRTFEHYHNSLLTAGNTIGYHYLVGDDRIVKFLEDNVSTNHTGDPVGNRQSIGIERLVNVHIDFPSAIAIQAKLAATLMYKHGIPIQNVVTHKFWSGKECPARLLAGVEEYDWNRFINLVQEYYTQRNFFYEVLEVV